MTSATERKELLSSIKPYEASAPRTGRLAPHDIINVTDEDGRAVIGVLLKSWSKRTGREVRVWLYAEDYQMVIEAYGLASWTYSASANSVLVSGNQSEHPKTLARFIMQQRVRMLREDPAFQVPFNMFVWSSDRDPLNLRATNLRMTTRGELFKATRFAPSRHKPKPKPSQTSLEAARDHANDKRTTKRRRTQREIQVEERRKAMVAATISIVQPELSPAEQLASLKAAEAKRKAFNEQVDRDISERKALYQQAKING